MEEWKEYIVGDLGRVVTGKTPKTSVAENYGGTIPFLTPSDDLSGKFSPETIKKITELGLREVKNCLLPTGSVCVSCIGSDLGKVVIIKKPTVTNQQFNSIIPNKENDADFIYYLMTIIGKHLNFLSKTSTAVPIINKSTFASYPIRVPSLETQKRIASILSSLDDKIELNRKINANLEAQAQALFKSWFVDFEPFKDQPFVESELGMIPEGWKVGTFLDNVNVMPGGTPSTNKTEYWTDGAIPFFCPKDVNGVYCFKTEKNITELGLNNCSSHLYPKDTLFITARGTVGKLALAGLPMAMNQSNYALVAKEGISKFYLYLLAQTLIAVLLKKANGAVFSAITTRDFNEPTIIPPTLDIKHFDNLVSPIFNKIYQTEQESRRLASLRDTLLPRLMSGELKVNEVI